MSFAEERVSAWGRLERRRALVARPRFAAELADVAGPGPRLGLGARRSYGDLALSGRLVDMTRLDRFKAFDPETGVLTAEAGLTLDELIAVFAPRGWFPPVVPGTRFVTLGGAVANDVHGKNHHTAGTFGRHVLGMTLERSGEGRLEIGPGREGELFAATVGGLGLTGVIADVTMRLQRIPSTDLDVRTVACGGLDELCDALADGEASAEHTVAWIDGTARGRELGRGIVTQADWAADGPLRAHARRTRKLWRAETFSGLLHPLTVRAFNEALFHKGVITAGRTRQPYAPVLHPLDSIEGWNAFYGRRGFFQHQCVIPKASGREPIREMLEVIAADGHASFLAVLKGFGGLASPGLLSFPREGLTLALDFANRGAETLALLERLDAIVMAAGGRLYPAKDARMSPQTFARGYPNLDRFRGLTDPACVSDFSRRMGL